MKRSEYWEGERRRVRLRTRVSIVPVNDDDARMGEVREGVVEE